MDVRDRDFRGYATGSAVETLAEVLAQREKTKRLLIAAACIFFAIAAIVVVFAPPSKQGLAYALGAALVVMALGAIGASQFIFKMPGATIDTRTGGGGRRIRALPEDQRRS